jgi:hypothetical protein
VNYKSTGETNTFHQHQMMNNSHTQVHNPNPFNHFNSQPLKKNPFLPNQN